ncbi:hypothetical protein KQI86_09770 [Clostridium sp. MSJ-11]|uniref:DUF4064 domain-containing protein n=1 Tax=Clostridium mobile TaxID=2841512 RepID=A0ABS6EHW5_9CLOT|nr:hypothetical protein [Clostridium mobile]MBU5484618.1 hypothetical protein [Clostridium mobile]
MRKKGLKDIYFDVEHHKYCIEDNSYEESELKLPQSKLGIASFAFALVGIVLFVISIILLVKTNNQGAYQEITSSEIMGTILLLISGILSFVGIGLGIAGMVTKNRKKIFPAIGIIINLLIALYFIAIIIAAISSLEEEQYEYKSIQVNSNKCVYSMTNKYSHKNI